MSGDNHTRQDLRSYGRRRGRAPSRRQAELWRDVLPRVAVDLAQSAPASLTELFAPPVAEVWLEIGFGGGEHLVWQARANPGVGLIGCEPFQDGVVKVLSAIGDSRRSMFCNPPLPTPPPQGGREACADRADPMTRLSHLNAKGEARMVDVSDKAATQRTARAEGFVAMAPETLALVEKGEARKGDVLATARIAGIMAAKKTHELIPLCHPLAITKATVDFEASHDPVGLRVTAEVKVAGQTGVEMEALTAVSIACLTIYDMVKAADKGMRIESIRLRRKSGGRSGDFEAP